MGPERWRPRGFRTPRFVGDVERFVDEVLSDLPIQVAWRRPAMELYERDDSFLVRAELPGLEKDDIDISITGETLTIKGERKSPEGFTEEQCRFSEIYYGSFSRTIAMPVEVDAAGIEATQDNGVLEISLPKARQAKATRIQVKDK